jgi:hypothetical protein
LNDRIENGDDGREQPNRQEVREISLKDNGAPCPIIHSYCKGAVIAPLGSEIPMGGITPPLPDGDDPLVISAISNAEAASQTCPQDKIPPPLGVVSL